MVPKLRLFVVAAIAVSLVAPIPCEAYVQRLQLPLSGHRSYPAAKGTVTFSEAFGETNRADGATLIIEISNVPLPAGTELAVIVHEKEVGKLKLDKHRRGRLVLESDYKTSVPRLTSASIVTVKIPGGPTVVW